jgi:His-Xaa-Ser system radical SAM maturase HxsC
MCSQPPKRADDSWIVDEILRALPLVGPATEHLGFTGGEPTLLGERFIQVLAACKKHLPNTTIHVLSNGRRFSKRSFARAWAEINHPALYVGFRTQMSTIRDYIVQAVGAYDDCEGHSESQGAGAEGRDSCGSAQQTYARLPRLAEFIARNLLFVDHVACMGLEVTGFTLANMDDLWVDPIEYQRELYEAVQVLSASRVPVSIYNLPRCLLPQGLWPFAQQSISDWKNEYRPECQGCDEISRCAGFFATSKGKHSAHIRPVRRAEQAMAS